MRPLALIVTLSATGLIMAGCGWSPPPAPPTQPDACAAADGPTPDTVTQAIATLPAAPAGAQWRQIASGHTTDCGLHWVKVGSTDATQDGPGQVLFFDHNALIGMPTPEPRPYINVVTSGNIVSVQYQWKQGNDQPCCPTGIGTVRFQLADGKLTALDPVPNP
jgi:hypothetical protein